MLTARGRRTIALGLVAGLAGRILGIPELFGLAAAAVVVTLAALLRVRVTRVVVTLSARAVPPVVALGEPALIELTIEDLSAAGSLASAIVLLGQESAGSGFRQPERIVVPRLCRGGRANATFQLPTRRRGLIEAGAYQAAVTDPLGLARRPIATSRAARCVVLPRIEPLAKVVPRGLGWASTGSMRSAAERLVSGSSTLRRYVQGDDLRLVHWRTTARIGELMVREGGDSQDPDRIATTVLLDTGEESTPPDDLDRAVEVAASVLAAAADAFDSGASGDWRLVTTDGLDTGAQQGQQDLKEALITLAGVEASSGAARERFWSAAGGLRRPDEDEILVIVAFGGSPPERALLEDVAAGYFGAVLVLVGAPGLPFVDEPGAHWRSGRSGAAVSGVERSGKALLIVPLPNGRSLAAAWGLESAEPDPNPPVTDRVAEAVGK
ncbi:MAG: DUF58 domain-containing protein [Acidimicrobiales bacterium]